ncbi:MAG: NADP-dependent oxidoreductase [Gammaproteobacteria bacterium]|nr:NADP-dependent oxidoreductase [Gammaproteobacteria bacterium]
MKAAYLEALGGPEVLKYGDQPDPVPGPGEVVCDIHVATVNAADWQVRSGRYGNPVTTFPYILGRDFSGVVSAAGPGADLAVGDEVFGVLDVGDEGCYAEKVVVKSSIIAKKPSSLSHADAAAIALTGITAKISIEDTLKLQSGETILIHGGAGGVASVGIQIAKHLGAKVITTASASNHDYVRGLGADEIIDYNAVDFASVVSDVDAVFDTAGGDVVERSFGVLRPGGRAAFIASGPTAPVPERDDVTALRPAVGRDRPHLERVLDWVGQGAITIPDVTEYPLSDAVSAHRVSEARHLRGKLIFKVR